jgi:hypothetical protein
VIELMKQFFSILSGLLSLIACVAILAWFSGVA